MPNIIEYQHSSKQEPARWDYFGAASIMAVYSRIAVGVIIGRNLSPGIPLGMRGPMLDLGIPVAGIALGLLGLTHDPRKSLAKIGLALNLILLLLFGGAELFLSWLLGSWNIHSTW